MNYKYKNLLSNISLFTISNLGSKVLTVLMVPLYTSVLSTEEYGIIDLIISTINLLLPILTCCIAEGVLRFSFASFNYAKDSLVISFAYAFLGAVICALMYPLSMLINVSIGAYWDYAVILFLVMSLRDSYSSYVKGVDRTKIFAIQGVIFTFVFLCLNVILLVLFSYGISGYFVSLICANLVSIVYMFCTERRWVHGKLKWNSKLNGEMLKYCAPIIISTVAWWVNTSVDKYMITKMISVSENGIYSMGHKIPTLITSVTGVFSQAWLLSTIVAEENDSEEERRGFYSKIFDCYTIICVLSSFLVILLCKPLSFLMLKKEFFDAWRYVPLLTISALFSGYAGFWASFSRATKKTGNLFYSTVFSAIINIVLNWFLIDKFGTIGATIATAISFFVMWIIRVLTIRGMVTVKWINFSLLHIILLIAAYLSMKELWVIYPLLVIFIVVLLVSYKDILLRIWLKTKEVMRRGI